jgi:hypothetical protein
MDIYLNHRQHEDKLPTVRQGILYKLTVHDTFK